MEPWAEAPVDEASKAAGAEERLAKCHFGADFDVFSLYGNNVLICLGRGGGDLQNVIFLPTTFFCG